MPYSHNYIEASHGISLTLVLMHNISTKHMTKERIPHILVLYSCNNNFGEFVSDASPERKNRRSLKMLLLRYNKKSLSKLYKPATTRTLSLFSCYSTSFLLIKRAKKFVQSVKTDGSSEIF